MFIIIIALELPGLIRDKKWKELVTFAVLLLLGIALSTSVSLDLKIPNLTDITDNIFRPLSEEVNRILSVSN